MSCSGGHLGFPIGIKSRNFVEDLPMIIPGQFGFNCSSGFREEAFWNIFPIGSNVKLSPAVAAILNFISEQKTLDCRGPSTDYSWEVWLQLSKWFQRRCILKHFSHKDQCLIMSCRSRHFEFDIGTKNVKIIENHLMNIHVQFGFNHMCSFSEEGIWIFSHRVQC